MHDLQEVPLVNSLSDASTLNLKTRVSELFGQMKEPLSQGGSLQSLNAAPAPSPSLPLPSVRVQRAPVATNKAFHAPNHHKSTANLATETSRDLPPQTKTLSNASNLTSLCADISPCNSHFFEVLYIGKIKVSHKRVPETLIDDALAKFKHYEVEKTKAAQMRRNSLLSTQTDSVSSEKGSLESLPSLGHTKKVEFAPLPTSYKREEHTRDENLDHRIKDGLNSPSLTPLQTNKRFFSDEEDTQHYNEETNVEDEFDELSNSRVQNKEETFTNVKPLLLDKKMIPVALEPNVLVLNWNDNDGIRGNLTTLQEDDSENNNFAEESFNNNIINRSKSSDLITEKNYLINKDVNDEMLKVKNALKLDLNVNTLDEAKMQNNDSLKVDQGVLASSVESNVSESKDFFNSNIDDDGLPDRPALKGRILPENKQFSRDRSASIGTLNLNKTPIAQLIGDQNRTMLFQVARSDLRLISPDRKQVLLHRQLRDVASCVQGVSNQDHLGFICQEPGQDSFVGYVFKCESEGVASDVAQAITQAFVANAELVKQGRERSALTCEHCPMVWYHKLCQDLEGLSDKRSHPTILRRIATLPEEEQTQVITKYQGGTEDLYEPGEHNSFLMMLLRAHCEDKQQRHVHDTAENRSEFLNQYLGGSTIFMKAKRSLSSSFDHLLKRKASKDDFGVVTKDGSRKESSPMSHSITPTRDSNQDLHADSSRGHSLSVPVPGRLRTPSAPDITRDAQNGGAGAQDGGAAILTLPTQQNGGREQLYDQTPSPQLKSPMMDIFMKLGSSPSPKAPSPHNSRTDGTTSDSSEGGSGGKDHGKDHGSWRQAIYNRITQDLVQDIEEGAGDSAVGSGGELLLRRPSSFSNLNQAASKKKDKAELRELWKKGINQAILLIRMEKENARLRARQEVSAVKRIKLEYEDIGGCANENSKVWDMLTAPRDSRISTKVDSQMLLQAIKHGVPRAKRGEVWYFLAEQFCLRQPPPDIKLFPNYSTPYEALLKQLTSHQHAILIDLGRTFPSHTYFSSPLGPGQLALFNLLKAYSLLDPEVGYCQGLSFVAGVLLLHLDEAEAFLMLRHLMFRRGLRRQYLPDMIALQIQLYQLSRLLKDHLPELYERFDQYDVYPTLYAAPWILTIFTSQFPLGFVTRVFDLLFLESSEVIFRVAIALLDIHKESLLLCDSFEEIMEYLKHKMPNIDKAMLDKVIKLAFTLDFGRQLHEYQVEYSVLQEEMAAIAPKMEALARLETQSTKLKNQNFHLNEQLEIAVTKVSGLQGVQNRLENQVKNLEQTVASLARYIGTTHDKKHSELPNDIRRLCQQVQQNDRKTLGALGQKLGQSFSSKFASTDFNHFGSSTSIGPSVSEESSSDPDERGVKKMLKTGLSAPNLFNKIGDSKKDVEKNQNVVTNDPDLDKKRQYLQMKKSYSCNAGLMANANKKIEQENMVVAAGKMLSSNLKGYPLRVLDENSEYDVKNDKPGNNMLDIMMHKNYEALRSSKLSDASSIASNSSTNSDFKANFERSDSVKSKGSGFFAHSHEQIRQEKMQAEQLKKDFDDNLKRLDARLSPVFQESLSPVKNGNAVCANEVSKKLVENSGKQHNLVIEEKQHNFLDSGLGTPVSPNEKNLQSSNKFDLGSDKVKDDEVFVNHPLVGSDCDIKFEVHSSKLKCLRPTRLGNLGGRPANMESGDCRN